MSQVDPVVLGVGVLAVLGVLVAFRSGARTAHKVTQHGREVTRMGGTLGRALVCGAVIVGIQWAVIVSSSDPVVWSVVLGVPAVFAGSAVARMFAVTEVIHGPHRKGARR